MHLKLYFYPVRKWKIKNVLCLEVKKFSAMGKSIMKVDTDVIMLRSSLPSIWRQRYFWAYFLFIMRFAHYDDYFLGSNVIINGFNLRFLKQYEALFGMSFSVIVNGTNVITLFYFIMCQTKFSLVRTDSFKWSLQ